MDFPVEVEVEIEIADEVDADVEVAVEVDIDIGVRIEVDVDIEAYSGMTKVCVRPLRKVTSENIITKIVLRLYFVKTCSNKVAELFSLPKNSMSGRTQTFVIPLYVDLTGLAISAFYTT